MSGGPEPSRHAAADAAIASFWAWWAVAGPALAAALRDGRGGAAAPSIAAAVASIDPGLAWEVRPGPEGRLLLVLSASGDGGRRVVADRWRAAAPEDPEWAFLSRRPGLADPSRGTLRIAGERLDLADARVAWSRDESRERLNLTVAHPIFRHLPEATRGAVALLLLEHALGEEAVGSWIGAVDVSAGAIDGGADLAALAAAVAAEREAATGERWGLVIADTPRGASFLHANFAARREAWPLFDARCDVALPFLRETPAGIPDPWEHEVLEAIEEGLVAALGAHAVLVARRTCANVRTLHLYAREDSPAPEALRRWARGMDRPVSVRWRWDPDWDVLSSAGSVRRGEDGSVA